MSRLQVHLSEGAATQLRDLGPTGAGRMRIVLGRFAAELQARDRLVQIRTERDFAACEVLADQRILLVYAVIPRSDLLVRLIGPALESAMRMRHLGALTHGRGWR